MAVWYRITIALAKDFRLVLEIVGLGKTRPIQIHELIPYLEPRILDRAGEPVVGARSAEGEGISTRLEHTVDLRPEGGIEGGLARVPLLAHKPRCGALVDPISPVLSLCTARLAETLLNAHQ